MDKKLSKKSIDLFRLAVQKFEMSLQKTGFFNDDYSFGYFDEEIIFLDNHKEHEVWLIDDYFKKEKK